MRELAHEQAGSGPAALDRQAGRRRLRDRLAGAAGIARPDMADDLQPRRHLLQRFGMVMPSSIPWAAGEVDLAGLAADEPSERIEGRRLVGEQVEPVLSIEGDADLAVADTVVDPLLGHTDRLGHLGQRQRPLDQAPELRAVSDALSQPQLADGVH